LLLRQESERTLIFVEVIDVCTRQVAREKAMLEQHATSATITEKLLVRLREDQAVQESQQLSSSRHGGGGGHGGRGGRGGASNRQPLDISQAYLDLSRQVERQGALLHSFDGTRRQTELAARRDQSRKIDSLTSQVHELNTSVRIERVITSTPRKGRGDVGLSTSYTGTPAKTLAFDGAGGGGGAGAP
jgi:hypothetical protein